LHDYPASPQFSSLEKLVLEYADAMTGTPVEVADALFERLRVYFDQPQLVELTAAIAWENYRARFDHAFGVEAENFSPGQCCALPVRPHPGA
jgi:alkylhydroperoxidase family enzyme